MGVRWEGWGLRMSLQDAGIFAPGLGFRVDLEVRVAEVVL